MPADLSACLAPYAPLMDLAEALFGPVETWEGKTVCELGPGTRVDLLRHLAERSSCSEVVGAGRFPLPFWCRHKAFIRARVQNRFLLDFLGERPDASFDVILSRHVMERHSIDPWILLKSPAFWSHVRKGRMRDPGPDYPASRANLQAVFMQAFRVLKPGGAVLSQIAKKKYSVLDDAFLEGLHPKRVIRKDVGRISCVVAVVKG